MVVPPRSLRGSVSSLQGTLGTSHGAHTLRGEYLGAPEEQVRKRRFNTTSRRHLRRNSGEQVTIWRRNSRRRRRFRSMLGRLWRRLTASAQGRTGRAIRRQNLANARLCLFGRQAVEAGAIGRPVQDSRCATSLARTTGRTLQRDRSREREWTEKKTYRPPLGRSIPPAESAARNKLQTPHLLRAHLFNSDSLISLSGRARQKDTSELDRTPTTFFGKRTNRPVRRPHIRRDRGCDSGCRGGSVRLVWSRQSRSQDRASDRSHGGGALR